MKQENYIETTCIYCTSSIQGRNDNGRVIDDGLFEDDLPLVKGHELCEGEWYCEKCEKEGRNRGKQVHYIELHPSDNNDTRLYLHKKGKGKYAFSEDKITLFETEEELDSAFEKAESTMRWQYSANAEVAREDFEDAGITIINN